MDTYPQHIPAFLDKVEFDKDYTARTQIESRLVRLQGIAEQLSDTKTLLDHDNYHATLSFYQNLKFLSGQNIAGIKTLFEEMKQFFKGGRKKTETPQSSTDTGEKVTP